MVVWNLLVNEQVCALVPGLVTARARVLLLVSKHIKANVTELMNHNVSNFAFFQIFVVFTKYTSSVHIVNKYVQ